MGSKGAAYQLGDCYRKGKLGLPVDKEWALYWYRRVATGAVIDE